MLKFYSLKPRQLALCIDCNLQVSSFENNGLNSQTIKFCIIGNRLIRDGANIKQ